MSSRVRAALADGRVQRGEREALGEALHQAIRGAETPEEVDAYVAAVQGGLGFASWGWARTWGESRAGRGARREAELQKLTLGRDARVAGLAQSALSPALRRALTRVADEVTPSAETKRGVKEAYLEQLAASTTVADAGRLYTQAMGFLMPYVVASRFEVLTGLEHSGSWPMDELDRATVARQHQLDTTVPAMGSVVATVDWR
ncbi:MAG: hypothetical protein JNK82_10590 [Myxococcaceae bacterium]|nr:hypothetical protein [Myxococcaceae bacterium]